MSIDDCTRKIWIYFLKQKSEVFGVFKNFKALVEKQSGRAVKTLRSDQGGEYLSGEFEAFLKDNGIKHELTVSFSSQQNGVAERKNRIIMELVRSMLKTKSLPHFLWAEAAALACYVLNRAATKAVQAKTPEEAWSGHKPCVSHFRIFGSLCYSHIPKEKCGKLHDKSEKCIFVGYNENPKAYRIFNPVSKRLIISRDVIFDEQAAWDWKSGKENSTVIYDNNLLDPLEEEAEPVQDEVPQLSSPASQVQSQHLAKPESWLNYMVRQEEYLKRNFQTLLYLWKMILSLSKRLLKKKNGGKP